LQRIEYARQQAADAYKRATEAGTPEARAEWLVTAEMWESIARQYEMLANLSEIGQRPVPF
jgi:hypothetical protein